MILAKLYLKTDIMLYKVTPLFFTIFILLQGCADTTIDYYGIPVEAEAMQWIDWTNNLERGDTIRYSNSGMIVFKYRHDGSIMSRMVDCQIGGQTRQCQFQSIAIELISPYDSVSRYLTMLLYPDHQVSITPHDAGRLINQIIRFNASKEEFEQITPPELYETKYVADYNFESLSVSALIATTVDREAIWYARPPHSFVWAKGIGVIRWTDYEGNVFELLD